MLSSSSEVLRAHPLRPPRQIGNLNLHSPVHEISFESSGDQTSSSVSTQLQITSLPRELCDKFTVIGEPIRGGFGIVFKCLENDKGSFVAIKFPQKTDPTILARFLRERRLHKDCVETAGFREPYVVPIAQEGICGDFPYLITPWMSGKTLAEEIDSKNDAPAFNEDQIITLALQLNTAIDHLAKRGTVHRDITPRNIIIQRKIPPYDASLNPLPAWRKVLNFLTRRESTQRTSGDVKMKLFDFGLAVRSDDPLTQDRVEADSEDAGYGDFQGILTQPGRVPGTNGFIAPEIIFDNGISGLQSSIWQFGVILHYLACKIHPFCIDTSIENEDKRMYESTKKYSRVPFPDGFNTKLSKIIDKCLERNPDNRYRNMEELREALRACRK